MSNLLLVLVKSLVAAMAAMLSPQTIKAVIDKAFDVVEEKVKDSSTQWDDVIVLPMLVALRKALDIPGSEPIDPPGTPPVQVG